jgi:DNA-binding response OmpR family regulator
MRILVADDDASVLETIAYVLEGENHDVVAVSDGEAALAAARASDYDLLILNVMMPKLFGTDVLRVLHDETDTPIVLLSARDAHKDRVEGLDLGADDYITKPFSLAELASRVRAIGRRRERDRGLPPLVRRMNGIEIDYENGAVMQHHRPVMLTRSEFRLVTLLAERPGRVISRREIMRRLWQSEYVGDARACDLHVSNLRRKLGQTAIETVRGEGYRLSV